MQRKRSNSAPRNSLTQQHREQREQCITGAVESRRQHRGDSTQLASASLLMLPLRSIRPCCHQNVSAATLQCNSAATRHPRRSRHFICVSFALMPLSWRLKFAHDDYRCATADYVLPLKIFHNYSHVLFKMPPVKTRGQITFPGLARRLLLPSLDCRIGIPTSAPQISTP